MERDSFPLNDTGSGENPAPAAAIAAAPPLLASFSLKNSGEHGAGASVDNAAMLERLSSLAAGFDGEEKSGVSQALLQVPADFHQPLRDILDIAMRHVSSEKNIQPTPELQAALIDAIIKGLEPAKLCGIVRAEPGSIALMVNLLDYMLDIFAAMQVMHTFWRLRGFEELELFSFWKPAETWVRNRAANDIGRSRYWWPHALEMIVGYHRPQLPDRLAVRYPDSQKPRGTWRLDRAAFGAVKIGAERLPQFLLPRMSTCPCFQENYTPDGKQVSRSPNDVITAWHRNGVFHRDPAEGPAFLWIEPHRELAKYMVEGRRHRDPDAGPAWIDTSRDGLHIEEYYWQGQLHRPVEDGPAALHRDSAGNIVREIYAEHGQRHRDPKAGPALLVVENGQRTEEYNLRGILHRDEAEGPASTVIDLNTGAQLFEAYYTNGEYQRIAGPAVIYNGADGTRMVGWYRDGKLHRDTSAGPAHVHESPSGTFIEYAFNGQTHRDHLDGPAVINTDFEEKGILSEEYYEHGQRHRPSTEGPAILRVAADGKRVQESYHERGLGHRDPAQGPAWSGVENGQWVEAFIVDGLHHRQEVDGPAVTYRDLLDGRVTAEEYHLNGKKFRHVDYHPDGSARRDTWYRDGVLHRDPSEGPAVIWSGDLETRIEYYFEGRCHRDPAEGPARILRAPTGELVEIGFWVNGEQLCRYRSKRMRRICQSKVRRWERKMRREQGYS